jgi:spermidine synthase
LPAFGPDVEVVARAGGVLGELVLRRRHGSDGSAGTEVIELLSGGVFLMDTEDGTTERLLAEEALRAVSTPDAGSLRVLVGGLGLGLTAAAALADPRVVEVLVVEIEPVLTGWLREGLVPLSRPIFDDDRLRVVHGDVRDALVSVERARFHAVLLDVDNGPDFLTHPSNADLYRAPALTAAAAALVRGGVLAIWSAEPSATLAAALEAAVGPTQEVRRVVHRSGRDLEYVLYLATRS